MNVFTFRNRIIEDYSDYVSSFISISQSRLRDFVDRCFASGSLWPDPLIQLNPTFKPDKTVDELVNEGVLEPGCRIQATGRFHLDSATSGCRIGNVLTSGKEIQQPTAPFPGLAPALFLEPTH
jgi:hypothetical protein